MSTPIDKTIHCGLIQRFDQPLPGTRKTGRYRVRRHAPGRHVPAGENRMIDIRRKIQFAAAQLAHAYVNSGCGTPCGLQRFPIRGNRRPVARYNERLARWLNCWPK